MSFSDGPLPMTKHRRSLAWRPARRLFSSEALPGETRAPLSKQRFLQARSDRQRPPGT